MTYMPHWPKLLGKKCHSLYRIKSFLSKLGSPEKAIPPMVHIAGTNGKGSTLSFIRYILQAAGYKVHAYTSPHLVNFNERIVIAGEYINDAELYNILEECRAVTSGNPITLFEAATMAAYLAFSRNSADITLIEVGMGGRLDSTNVIEDPILSIITSISLDHTEYLGASVEAIAGEKAGIMKHNVPCILSMQPQSVMHILESHAIHMRSYLYRHGYEWICVKDKDEMIFQSSTQEIKFPLPSLSGDHQIINAGNAIAASSILSGKYGFNIAKEDICAGLKNTYWPARLEHIKAGKVISLLPNNWKLFLDGAHNSDGARAVSEWVKYNFPDGIYMIFGITHNRNIEDFLQHFRGYVRLLCAVCVKSELNAANTSTIKEKANNVKISVVECESITDAISNYISKYTDKKASMVLICGSLFLARDLSMEN